MKKVLFSLTLIMVLLTLAVACTSPAPTAVPQPTVPPVPTSTQAATPLAATVGPTPTKAAVSTSAPTPTPAPAATAVPGGSTPHKPEGALNVALSSVALETWLPWKGSGSETYMDFVMQTLLRRKFSTRQIEGNLAEKWEVSKDAKSWTFYLRKGIQWQDGYGEFTAEDVKYSAQRYAGKDSVASRAAMFRDVESFDIPNPYQITFRFKSPQASMIYGLTDALPYFMIVSKKYFETVGDDKAALRPVGTGPWRLVEHKLGDHMTFEAVDNHWRQTPYFKTLTVKIVPEASTRIAQIKTGEADIVDLSLALKKEAVKSGIEVRQFAGSSSATIKLPGQTATTWPNYDPTVPWVDAQNPDRALKVRKAMNLAINRQAIVDTILGGEGTPLANNLVVPGTPWSDPAWKPYPYDLDQAKALMKEAGYPDGFKITMWLFTLPGKQEMIDYAQAVGNYWEQIGIKVSYEVAEYGVKKGVMAQRGFKGGITFPMSHTIWDEPADNWIVTYNPKAPLSYGFEDPRIDQGLAELAAETDLAKRAELNRKMGDIIYKEYREVPIALTNALVGVGSKIGVFPQIPGVAFPHYYEFITHKGQQP